MYCLDCFAEHERKEDYPRVTERCAACGSTEMSTEMSTEQDVELLLARMRQMERNALGMLIALARAFGEQRTDATGRECYVLRVPHVLMLTSEWTIEQRVVLEELVTEFVVWSNRRQHKGGDR